MQMVDGSILKLCVATPSKAPPGIAPYLNLIQLHDSFVMVGSKSQFTFTFTFISGHVPKKAHNIQFMSDFQL